MSSFETLQGVINDLKNYKDVEDYCKKNQLCSGEEDISFFWSAAFDLICRTKEAVARERHLWYVTAGEEEIHIGDEVYNRDSGEILVVDGLGIDNFLGSTVIWGHRKHFVNRKSKRCLLRDIEKYSPDSEESIMADMYMEIKNASLSSDGEEDLNKAIEDAVNDCIKRTKDLVIKQIRNGEELNL